MADDLALSLKITGDATQLKASAKEAVASLEAMRRAQLDAFRAGKEAAAAARTQWKQAESEIRRLAMAARQSGADQGVLNTAMQQAQALAARSKQLWQQETQALQQRRAALIQNAAAMAQARQNQVSSALPVTALPSASGAGLGQAALGLGAVLAAANYAQKFIATADAVKLLEGRLTLATGSAIGMKVAMADVLRIANATGQDLKSVATLYTRLHRALKDMGASQKETAAITESVALALKISGATAEEAASATLQLSQAFASGVMQGEEFRAVMEAAPRLMQALADGMGIPFGMLRKLASEGKLTSEMMAKVLPAALDKLRQEAAGLPTTVGQAWQRLNNALAVSVGEFDKNTLATQKLAGAIDGLAGNLDAVLPLAEGLAIGGLGLAGAKGMGLMAGAGALASAALGKLAAALALVGAGYWAGGNAMEWFLRKFGNINQIDAQYEALSHLCAVHKEFNKLIAETDGSAMLEGLKKLRSEGKMTAAEFEKAAREIERFPQLEQKLRALKAQALATPNADINRTIVDAQGYANAWINTQQKLNAARETLQKLQLEKQRILAGQEVLTAKEAIDKQIRDLEKLKAAREATLQKALADLQKYRDAVTAALQKETDIRAGTADRIRELRRKGMSEEEQQADIAQQAAEKLAEAEKKREEAREAAARGDAARAEKAAAQAEKLAEQASGLGERLKETGAAIDIVGKAGNIAAEAANAVAEANQRAANSAAGLVSAMQKGIADLTRQIEALTRERKAIEVDAKVDAALAEVDKLQKALAALQDKTITVTVKTVEAHASGGPVGFARGGALPGYGGGDRIPAILEAGEYVVRKEAVRRYGLGTLHALNAMRAPLPVRAVHSLPSLPTSRPSVGNAGEGNTLTVRLSTPWGDEARVRSSRDDAETMLRILRRAGVKFST